jgi:AraC-like DNA-binding protein
MYFRSQKPHPTLAGCVDYYWYLSDAPSHPREHIVPSGTVEIVVNLHEDEIRIYESGSSTKVTRYSGAVVSGVHRRFFVIDTRAHASIIGVHLRPGGAFPLLGAPPASLTDKHANLEAMWGAQAAELRERLCTARDLGERFRLLDDELVRRLRPAVRQRDAVRVALRRLALTNARVGRVASEIELSSRQLIQIFTAEVGVAPKAFARTWRFQRAFALARRDKAPDWAQLALHCGYCDQSHLIRDFVALSGLSPSALLLSSADVKQHHAALVSRHR